LGFFIRWVISRKKYLTSIEFYSGGISIEYLNNFLVKKQLYLKDDCSLIYSDEVNRLLGERDQVLLSNEEKKFTFINLDKSIRAYILEAIGEKV